MDAAPMTSGHVPYIKGSSESVANAENEIQLGDQRNDKGFHVGYHERQVFWKFHSLFASHYKRLFDAIRYFALISSHARL